MKHPEYNLSPPPVLCVERPASRPQSESVRPVRLPSVPASQALTSVHVTFSADTLPVFSTWQPGFAGAASRDTYRVHSDDEVWGESGWLGNVGEDYDEDTPNDEKEEDWEDEEWEDDDWEDESWEDGDEEDEEEGSYDDDGYDDDGYIEEDDDYIGYMKAWSDDDEASYERMRPQKAHRFRDEGQERTQHKDKRKQRRRKDRSSYNDDAYEGDDEE